MHNQKKKQNIQLAFFGKLLPLNVAKAPDSGELHDTAQAVTPQSTTSSISTPETAFSLPRSVAFNPHLKPTKHEKAISTGAMKLKIRGD